jgi:hypothetical protein
MKGSKKKFFLISVVGFFFRLMIYIMVEGFRLELD